MKHFMFPLLMVTLAVPICHSADSKSAASLLPDSTVRSTSDRDADLIDALIRVNRTDDGLRICRTGSKQVDPRSDQGAKWVILESQILTVRQLGRQSFGDAEIKAAQKPVVSLLGAYPEHQRVLFLEAQLLDVRKEAAIYLVVQASILSDRETKEKATRSLLLATTDIQALIRRTADARSELGRQGDRVAGIDSDLNRLQQELGVDVVSLMLMQTELFPRGSDDCIAAATKAEQAANEAVARIPSNVPARIEIERLQVESMLRAGQAKRAATAFGDIIQSIDEARSPRMSALEIRIDLARDNERLAISRLSKFYGDDPRNAPHSIEMDLARLEYLLRFRSDEVGSWFDAIQQRGGSYARWRAEAIALSRLGTGDTPSKIDPALLAVEGRNWLRKGDLKRAAELLAAAAKAEKSAQRALRGATEAAAAFVAAGQPTDAATMLIDIALSHRQADSAADSHLQAVYLLRSSEPDRIEELLREQLRIWPVGRSAATARRWLSKQLGDQGRFVDAAQVVSQIPVDQLTDDDISIIASAWRSAFRHSIDPSLEEPSQRFHQSMRPLLESPLVRSRYRAIASMLLNRDAMAGLPESVSQESFIDALIDFRQQGILAAGLQSVPVEHAADVRWRLIRDGRASPQLRPRIAKLLRQWDSESEPTFDRAELLLWSGETDESIQLVRTLVEASGRDVSALKQAANLLGSANVGQAHQEAIRLWDSIAAGTRKGSQLWHEAKIAGIGLLQQAGNQEEANKRAKYILLTMPKIDTKLKQQYQSVIR